VNRPASPSHGAAAAHETELPWSRPFSVEQWGALPPEVLRYVETLEAEARVLAARVEELTAKLSAYGAAIAKAQTRLNQDSSNSSQPPSSDNPYQKKAKAAAEDPAKQSPDAQADSQGMPPPGDLKKRPGGKPGHRGHSQKLVEPDEVRDLLPSLCPKGGSPVGSPELYDVRQHFALAVKLIHTTHLRLFQVDCDCGKVHKAQLPPQFSTGFDPRLTAFVAETVGVGGESRCAVQSLLSSVFGIHASLGTIQKIVDRTSQAILPHYETIARLARAARINHFDETLWYLKDRLMWLWVMANTSVALFLIHPHRSKTAFLALVGTWKGILISDGYAVYRKWVELRQRCLAHLIRTAEGLSQHADAEIARFGSRAKDELQRLVHMAHAPPTVGQWNAFYARFVGLLFQAAERERKDDAGRFARSLLRELDHLWLFLEVEGVVPTNNLAERVLRFAVLWRKRSQGTASEKGCRWVERILSLRQTCRLRGRATFPVLVDALDAYFTGRAPDLSWIEEASAACAPSPTPTQSALASAEHPLAEAA